MVVTRNGLHHCAEQVGDGPESIVVPQCIYQCEYFEPVTSEYSTIFYDSRNRGQSHPLNDSEQLSRGILHDVEDLEAIRLHFRVERMPKRSR